jgi:hypothetical protein
MQAVVVQSTSSIRVIDVGNDATDQPELVWAMPVAIGAAFGEVALVGD